MEKADRGVDVKVVMSMVMHRKHSLAASVTWIVALVIATSMLVYAVFQYLTMSNMTVGRLLAEHTWHVMALGGLTYAALHFLLHKKIVHPIRQLNAKLYEIARGDNTPVFVKTNLREVQDMVDSVNAMLSQFRRTSHDPWVGKLRSAAETMNTLAKKMVTALDASDLENLQHLGAEMRELALMLERFEARAQNLTHELL